MTLNPLKSLTFLLAQSKSRTIDPLDEKLFFSVTMENKLVPYIYIFFLKKVG